MVVNVSELQKAVRKGVVVGEVGTVAPEFLFAASFAINVAMQ
jgi:hypothetical protein